MLKICLTESPLCVVFLLQDFDMQRPCQLPDRTRAQLIRPGVAHRMAGPVDKDGKFRRAIKLVRRGITRARFFNVHVPVGGAGG
jgi:hypothetical protein